MRRFVFLRAIGILVWLTSPVFGQSEKEKASLMGLVLDGATRQPIVDARIDAQAAGGQVANTKTVAPDGSFRLSLNTRDVYRVVVQAKGYINSVEQIDFSDSRVTVRYGKMIYLNKYIGPASRTPATVADGAPPAKPVTEPIASNSIKKVNPPAPVVTTPKPSATTAAPLTGLEPVFFAQSTTDILPESQASLDVLVRYLTQRPGAVVELAGHTDNQGDFDQNVALSRQRAEIVKNYVLGKGVKPEQIRTRGYGGTRPVATNNYEKTRLLNRRVEVMIVNE